MTTSKYLICRIAHIFGLSRKNICLANAASESHLLKEAEAYLGKLLWEKVEEIDALSMEYWNLRKLTKEREKVEADLKSRQTELTAAYEDRADMLGISEEPYQDLIEKRESIVNDQENLIRKRDIIVAKARDIHKIYQGLKTKSEVLNSEGGHDEQLAEVKNRLAELKSKFSELKKQRQEVGDQIAASETRIEEIENKIQERRKERTQMASSVFQHIGDANQTIANLRAELGVLDTQMRQLYSEIGRYLSREKSSPAAIKVCKSQKNLVDVIHALRRSVLYNQKLAEIA